MLSKHGDMKKIARCPHLSPCLSHSQDIEQLISVSSISLAVCPLHDTHSRSAALIVIVPGTVGGITWQILHFHHLFVHDYWLQCKAGCSVHTGPSIMGSTQSVPARI